MIYEENFLASMLQTLEICRHTVNRCGMVLRLPGPEYLEESGLATVTQRKNLTQLAV